MIGVVVAQLQLLIHQRVAVELVLAFLRGFGRVELHQGLAQRLVGEAVVVDFQPLDLAELAQERVEQSFVHGGVQLVEDQRVGELLGLALVQQLLIALHHRVGHEHCHRANLG